MYTLILPTSPFRPPRFFLIILRPQCTLRVRGITPAHRNSIMHEITQETLDHLPDPIAKLVWEKWIAEGKARLVTHCEVTACQTVSK